MAKVIQRRRGSTTEHNTFTGALAEITIDTTKDTVVVHDGSTVGGVPLSREDLSNSNMSALSTIVGSDTESTDRFLIYDVSVGAMKAITREELNNAIEADALENVAITGGTIDGTAIGGNSASTGNFSQLSIASIQVTATATELNVLDGITATTAELNFTDGVTSNIQTQLNTKAPIDNATFTGTTTISTADINGGAIDGASVGAAIPSTGEFTNFSSSGTASFTSTGAVKLPAGTTAQRPDPAEAGEIRINIDTDEFEGYNGTEWASVGGSAISDDTATTTDLYPVFVDATTGTAANVFVSDGKLAYKPSTGELKSTAVVASNGIVVNSATVSEDYTIEAGFNASSAGPISVDSGVTVTVSAGSVWTII